MTVELTREMVLAWMEDQDQHCQIVDAANHYGCSPQVIHDILNNK